MIITMLDLVLDLMLHSVHSVGHNSLLIWLTVR